MIITRKAENVHRTLIKHPGITSRPREITILVAKENYTKMFFLALFETVKNGQ